MSHTIKVTSFMSFLFSVSKFFVENQFFEMSAVPGLVVRMRASQAVDGRTPRGSETSHQV